MRIVTENGIFKKIIIIIIAIIVFNAIIPTNVSYALTLEGVGGPLIKPIVDLMMAIGDLCMDFIHKIIYDMETSIIKIDTNSTLGEIIGFLGAVLIGIILAAGIPVLMYFLAYKFLSIAITFAGIMTILTVTVEGAVGAVMFARSNWFSDEIVMPMYKITPEEIFSGEVNFFNVNFFKDAKDEEEMEQMVVFQNQTNIYNSDLEELVDNGLHSTGFTEQEALGEINKQLKNYGYSGEDILEIKDFKKTWEYTAENNDVKVCEATLNIEEEQQNGVRNGMTVIHRQFMINQGEWGYTNYAPLGNQLKPTVTKWYYAIRNFSLIAMMVILLYIGIRIMFCGVSTQKAKYKNMLIDWIVAVCLIFIMHYIMVFAMNIADSLIKIFGSVNSSQEYCVLYEGDKKIINALKKEGIDVNALKVEENGKAYIMWDAKNIVGLARVQAALNNGGNFTYVGWVMSYCVLVCYTVFFVFTYLKRAIYLTFLTVIAPLVAMTYPIDKIHDGKAQAFDMWIKEYIFNLMIQPVHLLLYTILISSAFDLASTNILYTLVAIGFMMHAENLLRKMFGFGKAETPGMLSGAAGTAIMMSTIDKLIPKKAKSESEKSKDKAKEEEKNKELDGQVKIPGFDLPGVSSNGGGSQDASNFFENLDFNADDVSGLGGKVSAALGKASTGFKKIGDSLGNPVKNVGAILKGKVNTTGNGTPLDWEDIGENIGKKYERFTRSIADGKPIRAMQRTIKRVTYGAGGAVAGATISLADDKPVESLKKNVPTAYKIGDAFGSR